MTDKIKEAGDTLLKSLEGSKDDPEMKVLAGAAVVLLVTFLADVHRIADAMERIAGTGERNGQLDNLGVIAEAI